MKDVLLSFIIIFYTYIPAKWPLYSVETLEIRMLQPEKPYAGSISV